MTSQKAHFQNSVFSQIEHAEEVKDGLLPRIWWRSFTVYRHIVSIDIILHVMGPLNDPEGGQESELPGL